MDACLTLADFESILSAGPDETVDTRLHEHLDRCARCRERFEQHKSDETLAHDVRKMFAKEPSAAGDDETVAFDQSTERPKNYPNVDGYRITGVLGQGGMGIVYRAVQTRLNRAVALKVLPAMVGSASPSAVARFRREATAAARLHHTNIIPIYDFGESADAHFCAMELVSGQPLNLVIKRFSETSASTASPARLAEMLQNIVPVSQVSAIDPTDAETVHHDSESVSGASSMGRGRVYFRQVARWMADAADALHYAHGEGIIHRDIKPSNLILSIDGRLMIADFGLAKDVNEDSVTLTGSLLGTLRYMSPEQAMARRMRIDHRTDIYSLGATMYELLTMKPAIPGADDKEILGHIVTKDPISPRRIAPGVPRDLETICMKAMEKSPEARYDTARAFSEDLRRYINDLPVVAKQPGPIARTMKFVKRRRALVTAIAATALLMASIGLIVMLWGAYRGKQVENLVNEALRFVDERNWEQAESRYQRALSWNPGSIDALNNYAIMFKERYNAAEDPDAEWLARANDLLDRALADRPNDAKLWSDKGVILKISGDMASARSAFEKATGLDEANAASWINLGIADAHQLDLDAALQHLTRATKLAQSDYVRNFAWRTLASVQIARGELVDAGNALTLAKSFNSNDLGTFLLTAKVNLADRKVDQAIDWARSAKLVSETAQPRADRILAEAYLFGGDHEPAIKHADAALKAGESPALCHAIRAAAHAQLGQDEAARHQLKKAEQLVADGNLASQPFTVTSHAGLLWFEATEKLNTILDKARAITASDSG